MYKAIYRRGRTTKRSISSKTTLCFAGLRRALTLVEMLVTLSIVILLASILLPAIQAARETARKAQCGSNLRQLMLATQNYEAANKCFPYSIDRQGYGFLVHLLPFLEQRALFDEIAQTDARPFDQVASWGSKLHLQIFLCPSDGVSESLDDPTNYHGCTGEGFQYRRFNGVFSSPFHTEYGTSVTNASVLDGLSNTISFSEALVGSENEERRGIFYTAQPKTGPTQLDEFAFDCSRVFIDDPRAAIRGIHWWSSGLTKNLYNHVLNPNGKSCANGNSVTYGALSASSNHSGKGVNVSFADGRIDFIVSSIDIYAWRALSSRDGGESQGQR